MKTDKAGKGPETLIMRHMTGQDEWRKKEAPVED
jgi:hypothetical protein